MTAEDWEKVKEIFDSLTDLPPAERMSELESLDGGTRTAVERLLENFDAARDGCGVLDTPIAQHLELLSAIEGRIHVFESGELLQDRFEVSRELGRGGMGEVYEAFDRDLGERVAIKTVRFDLSHQPGIVARFKQEVQQARRVTHPNVCRVYDLFHLVREDGVEVPFLTMEVIDGPSLYELVRETGPLPEAEAKSIARQILSGLAAAHNAGIVHRDLKSGNILLDGLGNRRVVISDFGLARFMTGERHSWNEPVPPGLEGTLSYLSPELLSGQHASVRSDFYAAGVVLFRMLTGTYPFSEEPESLTRAIQERSNPPLVRDRRGGIDERWDAGIQACLQPEPERRPATSDEVATLLFG